MGTGSTSLGVKRLRCVADSSPLFSVEVNNACSDTATPPIILQGMYRDNFTFYILIIKERRCTNFSNFFFWNRTLHVSDRFAVHHQESSTVYTAKGICHTGYVDCLLAGSGWVPSWSRWQAVSITCMTYTYCCVHSTRFLMMDRKPVRNM